MADAYVPTSDATLRCAAGAGYTEAMDHPIAWQTQSGAIVPGMQATNAQGRLYGWHALVYRTCGVQVRHELPDPECLNREPVCKGCGNEPPDCTCGGAQPEYGFTIPLYAAPPSSLLEQAVKALETMTERLDGYLNSPEQVALGDEMRATLTALREALKGQQ